MGNALAEATRFRTNSWLGGQKLRCQCRSPHVILRGRCPKRKINFTKLAEPYPQKLCAFLGLALSRDAGLLASFRPLDIAGCAKCCGARVGEATNPGPAPARLQRVPGALGRVQLIEPQTLSLRQKHWRAFMAYLESNLPEADVEAVLAVPSIFATLIASYAQVMFDAGTPLHYYRQLVAHAQRLDPGLRPFLRPAWEFVSRWEALEPIQHRPPIPEPLLRAMVALAVSWGWRRWAAVMLLAYYGMCRVGEVLHASTADLLLPCDLLEEGTRILLRIREPKTRRRGARVQHATIQSCATVCTFLTSTLGNLSGSLLLYGGSPSVYRRRWDKLLERLHVPRSLRLTPGSLRGGGAVTAHKQGLPVSDLQWRMRLAHQGTLVHYLQDVTAASVIPSLSAQSRADIKTANEFFEIFLVLVDLVLPGALVATSSDCFHAEGQSCWRMPFEGCECQPKGAETAQLVCRECQKSFVHFLGSRNEINMYMQIYIYVYIETFGTGLERESL